MPCLDQDVGRAAEPRSTVVVSGLEDKLDAKNLSLQPGLPLPELQPGPSGRGEHGAADADGLEMAQA